MASRFSALAARAPDPVRAESALDRLEEVVPELAGKLERFLDQGAAFVHLLAISPVTASKLARDPEALDWLTRPGVYDARRGQRRMRAHFAENKTPGFDAAFRDLRRTKAREMLRLALREVAGWTPIEQSASEISDLAEVCLQQVCADWHDEFLRRSAPPGTAMAVLGMGKFGGQELNFSSDIDVIFFHGEDGELPGKQTFQQFYTRLAEKVIGVFSASDPSGALFRIDLRLRPEGASGPLVRSLDSMEQYYSGFGETWERMALIKARVVAGVAGADELGYEFTHRLQPFIFPRAVSMDVVDEIRAIKERIEREIVGGASLRRNVKLGRGGIREIEFVTQTLQILHGAKHAFLQERNTLEALQNLRQVEIIPAQEMETLIQAYRFLRTLEHRLQIESEAQTHTLPEAGADLQRLARSLSLSGALPEEANAEVLLRELARHTDSVREIFERVLSTSARGKAASEPQQLEFFNDARRAAQTLAGIGEGSSGSLISPRTRKVYARLEPLLLKELARVAAPDAALNRFARFVERYGLRSLLFETLIRSPRVLELLIRLFDASEFMTEIAILRPQLIEELARGGGLGDRRGVAENLAALAKNEENLPWEDWVRVYRRAQVLRIGVRDILAFAAPAEVEAEYSALAEACLSYAREQLGLADRLTVIAMGKFGGRELLYGADLDLVFIGNDRSAAPALIRAMTQRTSEGGVFPIDARLRPEGENGELILPLESYKAYFEGRAQLWEAQALTKSRPLGGPDAEAAARITHDAWRAAGARPDLFEEVAAMHARIVKDRAGASDALDFKTGRGGLMQIEFFVQSRQMRANLWEPNTRLALARLSQTGITSADAARRLNDAYQFFRRVEAALRRIEETSVSRLPASEEGRRQLAIRCGFKSAGEFQARFTQMREVVMETALIV